MDDEEEFDLGLAPIELKINRYDVVVVVATFVQGVAEAVAASAALTRQLAGGHSNYLDARRRFQEEAALEIESIPTEPEE